jgi:anti-sigma B factor antagonist
MIITKTNNDNTITLVLSGRLDSVTQSQLADSLAEVFTPGPVNLVFNFTALDYISSAGLRVLLTAQKKVNASGNTMKIVGVKPEIKEIFEMTGFTGIMTIELNVT